MPWQQLRMPVGSMDNEQLEQVLLDAGALSITYTDAADQPILEPAPGEVPMWREAIVQALFKEQTNVEQISLHLISGMQLSKLPDFDVELLADRDWEREWLVDFKPMQFGERLWVCPHEFEHTAAGAITLRLDPGLAFGTGTHPTTALCLTKLSNADLSGKSVLDFGSGSGILGIAALLLGAKEVLALDIDPQALTASENNARENHVADRLTVGMPSALESKSFDVVIANILAKPLIELASTLSAALQPGGQLMLSGILEQQATDVMQAYAQWIDFAQPCRQDGWVLLTGERRTS